MRWNATYRTLARAAFSPQRLKTYEAFISEFANPIPRRVICDLLGLPWDMALTLRTWSDMVGELRSDYLDKQRAMECHAALPDYESYLEEQILARRKNPHRTCSVNW